MLKNKLKKDFKKFLCLNKVEKLECGITEM